MVEKFERAEICSFCKHFPRQYQNVPPIIRPHQRITQSKTLPRPSETNRFGDDWRQLVIIHEVKATGKEIGRGAYGRVFEVEYRKAYCAAKEMHPILLEYAQDDQKSLQNIKENFFNECHIWSQLEHPCIVQFIGLYYPRKSDLPVIVMEKMHNSLRGLIENDSDVPIPFTNVLSILNDVCLGLQYLHSKDPPIVHRDLTPSNILLCFHLRAKITDLGVARTLQVTDTKTLTRAPGTNDFMPPESLTNKPIYGLSLDVFSFGGVILYIATQKWPHPAPLVEFDPDTNKKIVLTELQRRQQYLDKMIGIYEELKPLVASCLDDIPKNRPSVAQVLLDIKNTYCQKFFSAVWGTKYPGEQQLTQELKDQVPELKQDQQQQIQKQQLQQREQQQHSELQGAQQQQQQQQQKKQQQVQQEMQLQREEKELPMHQDLLQKHDENQQWKEQQLSQPSLRGGMDAISQSTSQVIPNCPLYIGEYDYCARTNDDMSFKKGDLLYILSSDQSEEWWLARAKESSQEGYIPSNHVTEYKSLDADYKEDYTNGTTQQLSGPHIQPDKWEIDSSKVKFEKRLQMGDFDEVWSGLLNRIPVAIKMLKPHAMEVADFVAEAEVMKQLDHPNLLKFYGICTLEEPIFMITESMKYGVLLDYLRKGDGKSLKLPELIGMAAQVAGGMAYLEEHSYIHRDLTARNILVGDDYLCKIANFRSAQVIKEDVYNPPKCIEFSVKWTAPEAALYNKFSIKSDVWSFGVVIYELITGGAIPYPLMKNPQVLPAVEQGYRMPSPNNCPDALYSIMLSCWKRDVDERPTFEFLKYQLEDYYISVGGEVYYSFVA